MMIKNHVKNIIIFIAIAAIGLAAGFFHARSLGVSMFEEKVYNVKINNEGDITMMGASFHNNICTLESDISISRSSMLSDSELPFVGVFDGQGHTITFSGDVEKSLFGYIGEGGVVKNLNIEVLSAEIYEKTAAVLALENKGTIMDCKVTFKSAKIAVSGSHASVVAVNRGTIKNVYAVSNFVNDYNTLISSSARRSVIGGIAAYNFGEISSSISEINFEGYDETVQSNIFSGSAVNTSVGAVCGTNNGIIKHCAAIVGEGVYTADNKNTAIDFALSDAKTEIFNEDMLFVTLGFSTDRWVYTGGAFMLAEGE